MEGPGSGGDKGSAQIRTKQGELLIRDVYEKDKPIFSEGQDSNDAFVVKSGKIGVFKDVGGKQVKLAVLEKGAIFGEMAAITGEKRTATMIPLEQSVCVRISRAMVLQKMGACDPFVKALIHILINNLSRVNERYVVQNKMADKLLHDLKASTGKAGEH